ncbi:MAG: EamA family transporter [Phycisphaeraceae bacterium]|nr:EamA family transporter [Phycisphaeraceae bacterium]
MLAVGIICGLASATAQSTSYVFSRRYVGPRHDGAVQLLVLSHVIQGAVSLPLLVLTLMLVQPAIPAQPAPMLLSLLGNAGFYIVGQMGLFIALRHTQPSRVSPMLGLKVLVLAGLTVGLLHDTLTGWQWAGAALCAAAAWALNGTGGSIPRKALAALSMTIAGYSLSDFCIRLFIDSMAATPRLQAGMICVFACYVVSGVSGVAMLPWFGSRRLADWRDAVPFAVAWFISMCLLYVCFALLGIVFGNIMQSTRGLISIGMGAMLAHLGHHHLEQKLPRGVLVGRLIAAVLMTLAVGLFVWK